jgi:iron complex outermembrane receptor protein
MIDNHYLGLVAILRLIFRRVLNRSYLKLRPQKTALLRPSKLRLVNLVVFVVFTSSGQALTMNKMDNHNFYIPSQTADLSLISFAEQANITLLFPIDRMQHLQTNLVSGKYTIAKALRLLLENTGLKSSINSKGQLSILIDPIFNKADNMFVYEKSKEVTADIDNENIENSRIKLEIITVGARRRSENLQEVPDSIVSMSEDLISRANINTVRDVSIKIPNVSIVESLSPTSTFIIVRGVSSIRNSEPAVALIVDGVQVGSASEVSQSFYDVEQIELLKGPQGALFGRNAIGGALIINSKKPTDVLEGKLSTGSGANGLFQVSGAISGPINQNLSFRIAGNHQRFDGTIENEFLNLVVDNNNHDISGKSPTSTKMNFEENNDFRLQLLWEPSEKTSLDYRYSINDLETGSMWYRNIYRLESEPEDEYEFPINSNGNPTAFRTIESNTLKIDHELDLSTLTSISSYTETNERYGVAGEVRGNDRTGNVLFFTEPFVNQMLDSLHNQVDKDFFNEQFRDWAMGNFIGSDQYYDIRTYSQELRVVSDNDNKTDISYVAGAYFLITDRTDTIRSTWETPTGSAFDCEPTYPGGPIVSNLSCNGLTNSTQNRQDNTAWALFFSTDYQINHNLTLTSALRYDEDKRQVTRIDGPTVDTRDNTGVIKGVGACHANADPENCAKSESKISETFSALQPKISLAYKPTSNTTYYGTYARGFRSGGFNASGALLTDKYDKETLDSFEVGLKATLLEKRIRTNMAMFYQDYRNVQQFAFDGNIFVQSLYNIPESNISGIETNIEFAATDNLVLSVAFGLMDSSISRFDDTIFERLQSELKSRTSNLIKFPEDTQAAFDKKFKGEKLPNFAHHTANVSLQYSIPLTYNRYLTTRVDYSYFGDRQWWLDGENVQNDIGLIDASLGLEIYERFELSLWCKNCFNKKYDSEYSPNERELFDGPAKDVAYRAIGRTMGVKLDYSF